MLKIKRHIILLLSLISFCVRALGDEDYQLHWEIDNDDMVIYHEEFIDDGYFYKMFSIGAEPTFGLMGFADSTFNRSEITIPDSVIYHGVKYMVIPAYEAFKGCDFLKKVVFAEGCQETGREAFCDCTNLSEVVLSNTITRIDAGSFEGCTGLKEITIPGKLETINSDAFAGCISLTEIELYFKPNHGFLGSFVFQGCISLASVAIKGYDKLVLNPYLFKDCHSLSCLEIEGFTEIDEGVFENCTSLTSTYLTNQVTVIKDFAYKGCTGIDAVVIPASVKTIGEGVFADCSSLESIYVDSGNTFYDSRNNCNAIVETASDKLIAGCVNTVIPESVSFIGAYAFCGHKLNSLHISRNITSIGDYAFTRCNLKKISVDRKNRYFDSRKRCNAVIESSSGRLLCASEHSIIPNGVTEITSLSFSSLNNPIKLTVPKTVRTIASDAFLHTSVSKISVSRKNKHYDSRQKCNAVLRTSDSRLVAGCSKTVIPESTKTIGKYAFYDSEINITGIPQNVDSIMECAFMECKEIEIMSLPDSLSYIGPGAFDGCSNLQSILIPPKVNKVSYYTFRNCTSLKNVFFKEGLKVIEDYSFEGCKLIDYIEIPTTVYYIGSHSFTGCNSLKNANLLCTEVSVFSDSFDKQCNVSSIGTVHFFK